MYDLDETYLLQSYNQNEPLFANLNKLPAHKNGHDEVNKVNRPRLDSCKKAKNNKIHTVSQEQVLNVRMLESICEDDRENQKTASKKNKPNFKSISASENRTIINHSKGESMAAYDRKSHAQCSVIESKDLYANSASLKVKLTLQPQHEPEAELEQVEYQQNFINSSHSAFARKYKELQQILSETFRKYSILTNKIEQYEELIVSYQQLIQRQQQLVRVCLDDFVHIGSKISTSSSMQASIGLQYSSAMIKSCFDKVHGQIIQTINEKTKHIHIQAQMTTATQRLANSIKYSKSVPILQQEPDTSCQSPLVHTKQANANNISVSKYTSNESASKQSNSPAQLLNKSIQSRRQQTDGIGLQNVEEFKTARFVTVSQNTEQSGTRQQKQDEQSGETFRRIANFRIKQLETQNTLMKNEVQSSNAKIMVIKSENKELKEIIEGLIVQIHKLNSECSTKKT